MADITTTMPGDCCCKRPLHPCKGCDPGYPTTLYVTFTTACGILNGVTVTLTYNAGLSGGAFNRIVWQGAADGGSCGGLVVTYYLQGSGFEGCVGGLSVEAAYGTDAVKLCYNPTANNLGCPPTFTTVTQDWNSTNCPCCTGSVSAIISV